MNVMIPPHSTQETKSLGILNLGLEKYNNARVFIPPKYRHAWFSDVVFSKSRRPLLLLEKDCVNVIII